MDELIGGVYFIQNRVTGNIKIGHAKNVWNRITSLQTGSDCELTLVYFVQTYFKEAQEEEFHRRFQLQWIRGEWFRCEGELKEFLIDKCGVDTETGHHLEESKLFNAYARSAKKRKKRFY